MIPDIVEIKRLCASGQWIAKVDSGKILLHDTVAGETVCIGNTDAEPVRHAKVLYNVAIEKEECCGYKKRKGLVLQKYTCSSCYTAIPGESKFCMECGAKLIWRNEDD